MGNQPIERAPNSIFLVGEDPGKIPTQAPRAMPEIPDFGPREKEIDPFRRANIDTDITRVHNLMMRDFLCASYGVPEGGEIPEREEGDKPITSTQLLAQAAGPVIDVPVGPQTPGEPVPVAKFNLDSMYPFTGEHKPELACWRRIMESLPHTPPELVAYYDNLAASFEAGEPDDEPSEQLIALLLERFSFNDSTEEDDW
ncbi:hypothetical protein MaudCBS49596_006208 [Microsporum audouinii]